MAKQDRLGKRKQRTSFNTRVPDLGYYCIVTDTKETEQNYMEGFKNSLPKKLQGRIVIKVSKAKTEDLVNACKYQAALVPQYSEAWIIFDRDKVIKFDEIIFNAKTEGINVGWSNPCIEIWFDAYFGKIHPYHDSVICCREFGVTFEKKTGQEYKKADKQVYNLLSRFGDESRAINIAETRYLQHMREGKYKPSEMCPCTTVHRLIDEIKEKIERSL